MKKPLPATILVTIIAVTLTACSPSATTQPGSSPSPSSTPAMQAESSPAPENMPLYTLAEVSQHAAPTDCWTSINGEVYNLTPFVTEHPGGAKILQICGKDGTELFTGQHGQQQLDFAQQFKIGTLTQ